MVDSGLSFLATMVGLLADKFGPIGTVIAYVLFFVPIVSVLIELLEFCVQMTESKADDAFAAKVRAAWDKAVPFLEILPHSNLPISPILMKVAGFLTKGVAAVKGGVQGWLTKK